MDIDEYRRKVSDARFEFCRENKIPWEPVFPPHLSSPSYLYEIDDRDEIEDSQPLPTTAMKIQTSPFKPSKHVVFAYENLAKPINSQQKPNQAQK